MLAKNATTQSKQSIAPEGSKNGLSTSQVGEVYLWRVSLSIHGFHCRLFHAADALPGTWTYRRKIRRLFGFPLPDCGASQELATYTCPADIES